MGALQPGTFQPYAPHPYYYMTPPAPFPSPQSAHTSIPSGPPATTAPSENAASSSSVPPLGGYAFGPPNATVDHQQHSAPPMLHNLHFAHPQPAMAPVSAQDATAAPPMNPATSTPAAPLGQYPHPHLGPGGYPGYHPSFWPPPQMMPYAPHPYVYPPNGHIPGPQAAPHPMCPPPAHVTPLAPMYGALPQAAAQPQQPPPSDQQMAQPASEPQTTPSPSDPLMPPALSEIHPFAESTPPPQAPSINSAPFSETQETADPLDPHPPLSSIGTQAPDQHPVAVSETTLPDSPLCSRAEFEADSEDRAPDDSFDDFIATLKLKLAGLPFDERVDWVTAAFEQLGMQKSIDAIVETFGKEAVYCSSEKSP